MKLLRGEMLQYRGGKLKSECCTVGNVDVISSCPGCSVGSVCFYRKVLAEPREGPGPRQCQREWLTWADWERVALKP